ncbi:MAG: hypothetical protein AAF993_03125 [Pseudomonadota bacterium]
MPVEHHPSVSQKTVAEQNLSFRDELRTQRFDDHRYYHQSRINQTLHLISATSFMAAYVLLFTNLTAAVMMGWLVAMVTRQSGHFFFEPREYDRINRASHEHKEDIKVGYNLQRKRILHGVWAIIPFVLYLQPSMFGLMQPAKGWEGYFHNLAILWFVLAVSALLLRTVYLIFSAGTQCGLVWITKILTDPFNDFKTYLKSPLYLLKGELMDPMPYVDAPQSAARND